MFATRTAFLSPAIVPNCFLFFSPYVISNVSRLNAKFQMVLLNRRDYEARSASRYVSSRLDILYPRGENETNHGVSHPPPMRFTPRASINGRKTPVA